jgi:hypothetical protein
MQPQGAASSAVSWATAATYLLKTSAAAARLAEGQFLDEEQTLNNAKSVIYLAGTRRPTLSTIIIIQFNSILYYLCDVPTAARPITDTAQCKKKSNYILDKNNINSKHN